MEGTRRRRRRPDLRPPSSSPFRRRARARDRARATRRAKSAALARTRARGPGTCSRADTRCGVACRHEGWREPAGGARGGAARADGRPVHAKAGGARHAARACSAFCNRASGANALNTASLSRAAARARATSLAAGAAKARARSPRARARCARATRTRRRRTGAALRCDDARACSAPKRPWHRPPRTRRPAHAKRGDGERFRPLGGCARRSPCRVPAAGSSENELCQRVDLQWCFTGGRSTPRLRRLLPRRARALAYSSRRPARVGARARARATARVRMLRDKARATGPRAARAEVGARPHRRPRERAGAPSVGGPSPPQAERARARAAGRDARLLDLPRAAENFLPPRRTSSSRGRRRRRHARAASIGRRCRGRPRRPPPCKEAPPRPTRRRSARDDRARPPPPSQRRPSLGTSATISPGEAAACVNKATASPPPPPPIGARLFDRGASRRRARGGRCRRARARTMRQSAAVAQRRPRLPRARESAPALVNRRHALCVENRGRSGGEGGPRARARARTPRRPRPRAAAAGLRPERLRPLGQRPRRADRASRRGARPRVASSHRRAFLPCSGSWRHACLRAGAGRRSRARHAPRPPFAARPVALVSS